MAVERGEAPSPEPNRIDVLVGKMRVDTWWYYSQEYRVWGNQSIPPDFLGVPTYKSNYSDVVRAASEMRTIVEQDPSTFPAVIEGLLGQVTLLESEQPVQKNDEENVSNLDLSGTKSVIEELILGFGPTALPYLESHPSEKFARKLSRKIRFNEKIKKIRGFISPTPHR